MPLSSGAAGALGSVASSIIGGGLSMFGSSKALSKSYEYSKKFSRKLAQYGPRWQMYGYRKAGLNPILAAGLGGGSGAELNMEPPDLDVGDTANSAVEAAVMANEIRKLKGEADSARAQGDVDKARRDILLKTGNMTLGIKGSAPIASGARPSLLEQQIEAALQMTRSSAASNDANTRFRDAMAMLPPAQVAEIENAIKNRNLTDKQKAILQAIMTAAGITGDVVGEVLRKPGTINIPKRPRVGF